MSEKTIVEYKLAAPEREQVEGENGQHTVRITKTLEEVVNELLADGWQPFESPISDQFGRAQAMVKYGSAPVRRPASDVLTRGRT